MKDKKQHALRQTTWNLPEGVLCSELEPKQRRQKVICPLSRAPLRFPMSVWRGVGHPASMLQLLDYGWGLNLLPISSSNMPNIIWLGKVWREIGSYSVFTQSDQSRCPHYSQLGASIGFLLDFVSNEDRAGLEPHWAIVGCMVRFAKTHWATVCGAAAKATYLTCGSHQFEQSSVNSSGNRACLKRTLNEFADCLAVLSCKHVPPNLQTSLTC